MDEEEGVIRHHSSLSADKEAMAAKIRVVLLCVCPWRFGSSARRTFFPHVLPACSPRAPRAQPG